MHGAGGFGKTKAAEAVCADPRVHRRFGGRVHMVTIGRDARSPSAIAALVGEVTRLLTGDQTTFESPRTAGEHLAKLLNDAPPTLLVLDDVWHPEQVAPFRRPGQCLVLLVTTRRPAVLPGTSELFQVDEMRREEAHAVLAYDLDALTPGVAGELTEACGNWPLLLRLANRTAAALVSTGKLPDEAARLVLARLRAQGPAGLDNAGSLDLADPGQCERAVSASLELAFDMLPPGGRERFAELGVFAEDEEIPVELVTRYWNATGGLEDTEARMLCRALADLSLLSLSGERDGALRLHDVYRDLLRAELGGRLPQLHAQLVQAAAQDLPAAKPFPGSGYTGPTWWESLDGYVSDHLIEHMAAAGERGQAESLTSDLRWISARLRGGGAGAPLRDLACTGTATAAERSSDLSKNFHLLRPAAVDRALPAILASRIAGVPAWSEQAAALTRDPGLRPLLVNGWAPADAADPAMLYTFPSTWTPVTAVAFSHDTGALAVSTKDDIEIIGLADGTRTALTASGLAAPVVGLFFSNDGTRLAAINETARLRIIDYGAKRTLRLPGRPRSGTSVERWITPGGTSFAQDGSWLGSTGFNPKACLRKPFSYEISYQFEHDGPWKSPVLGPERAWLAAIKQAEPDEAWVWDLGTGEPRTRLDGHEGKVVALALAPDGAVLASSGDDATVRLWDTATWSQRAVLRGHEGPVTAVVYDPDGKWLASSGADGIIRFWSPHAPHTQLVSYSGHSGPVKALAAAPDGTRIASGGADGTVRVWQVPGARTPASAPPAQGARNFSVPSYADGSSRKLLSSISTKRGTISTYWYPSPAKPDSDGDPTLISRRFEGWVPQLAVSPDGSWIASGSMDRLVRIWDPDSGTITTTLDHDGLAFAVAAGPGGAYVASADLDGNIRFSDPFSGALLRTLSPSDGTPPSVTSLTAAPDGSWLAARSWLGGLRVWQAGTGSWTAIQLASVYAMTASRDGSMLAIRNGKGVLIEECATGKRIFAATSRLYRTGTVHSLALSPDGRHLIAGDDGPDVEVWDIEAAAKGPGKIKSTTISLMSQPYALAFSPEGRWLASTHDDETLRIWDVATWRVAAEMRAAQWYGACAWAPDGSRLYVLGQNTLYHYDWRP
jgi:WD40 repeat protein